MNFTISRVRQDNSIMSSNRTLADSKISQKNDKAGNTVVYEMNCTYVYQRYLVTYVRKHKM